MKFEKFRVQLHRLLILALAAGIGFVYPVHVVVDHSGLFDHHDYHHHHDDNHSGDPEPDDDLCAFCLVLNSMEASESQNTVTENGEFTNYILKNGAPGNVSITGKSARAPPVTFLIFKI